ncbi:ferritin [Cohnella thailandensis]|jgi:Ferritin-like protein|uniref:Ferritin n=1 Tax=Cohnella thailandensis TaxID=557557 RepID=A0A841SRY6_9BACL|nr:ferritin [Cohnella thailandensis]MBB6633972.1 ferritin [Cohnella thailandensis]MBP1972655.1 ferritin [Cohnella thailandensis]
MLNQTLLDKLNDQMNYEFYSSQVYLAMAAYCSAESYDGFANFFVVQAEEEKFHAMKIYHFINQMGKRAVVTGMPNPQVEYESLLDAFEHSYAHEQTVTKRIYALSDAAWEDREHATINFLKWFIDEQVEEEDTFDSIIQKLRRIDVDSNALYMMDAELATRSFTPPAGEAE